MSKFDLDIVHVPGKANVVADALSYCHDGASDAYVNIDIGIESDFLDHIHRFQQVSEDPDFCEFCRCVVAGERSMCLHENLVCCVNRQQGRSIIIPPDLQLRQHWLALYHNNRLGGYVGLYHMIGVLLQRYYWPKMQADVKAYIKQCQTYQACNVITQKPQGLLQTLPVP